MYLMRNHDVWIYVRCANSDPRIAFDRLYDLIDEAAGHGFLVRGTSSRSRHSERHKLKSPAATASRPPTIASDIEVATTANMPYPNDWSVVTAAAPTSESLGASTAESKSSGDASTDLNTERSFAATHPLSPKQSCIKQF